jgi:hypothetical protein
MSPPFVGFSSRWDSSDFIYFDVRRWRSLPDLHSHTDTCTHTHGAIFLQTQCLLSIHNKIKKKKKAKRFSDQKKKKKRYQSFRRQPHKIDFFSGTEGVNKLTLSLPVSMPNAIASHPDCINIMTMIFSLAFGFSLWKDYNIWLPLLHSTSRKAQVRRVQNCDGRKGFKFNSRAGKISSFLRVTTPIAI